MKRATLIAGLLATSIGYASAPTHQPPPHEPPTHDDHAGAPAASDHTSEPTAKHAAAPSAKKEDAHHDQPKFNLDPREAMARLIDGNDRFRYGESKFSRFDQARRSETFANGQKPFAAVLSCADSRAPVEAIFDQGIGDLFVIRVAGNVADSDEIGTIEYGVGHLGTGLIVVLGHTKCGAVTAVADGAEVHGHIAKLVDNIVPAVDAVKERDPDARGARLIRLSIRANVQQSMHDLLSKSETISAAVKNGSAKVVGGVYDLQTGAIEWLGEHPQQTEILATGVSESSHDSHAELKHDKAAKTDPHKAHDDHVDKADQHDDHAKPAGKQSKAPAKPQKENWLALGGLLGASAVGSFATIHLLYGKK